MPLLNSKIHILSAAIIAASFSFLPSTALANPPSESEIEIAPPAETALGGFAGSDINGDGQLDLSEFTLYAGNQAVAGDPDFTTIVSLGDYETAFQLMDVDASGSLSADEVLGEAIEANDPMPEDQIESENEN